MLVMAIIIFVCHSFLNVVSILPCTSHYDRYFECLTTRVYVSKRNKGSTNADSTKCNKLRDYAANRKARACLFGDRE